MSHRVRVGFFLTMLLGAMWASAGLFSPTETQFVTGTVVAIVGMAGFSATKWID